MTHVRKIMLEELHRRNYAQTTIDCYVRTVEHFSRYFHRSPEQFGPQHIHEYQAALFKKWKLARRSRRTSPQPRKRVKLCRTCM